MVEDRADTGEGSSDAAVPREDTFGGQQVAKNGIETMASLDVEATAAAGAPAVEDDAAADLLLGGCWLLALPAFWDILVAEDEDAEDEDEVEEAVLEPSSPPFSLSSKEKR